MSKLNLFNAHRFDVSMTNVVTTRWRIVVEAVVGGQERGDITLDDLVFRDGCKVSSEQALPPGTTPAPTPSPCPDGQFVCGDKTCVDQSLVLVRK